MRVFAKRFANAKRGRKPAMFFVNSVALLTLCSIILVLLSKHRGKLITRPSRSIGTSSISINSVLQNSVSRVLFVIWMRRDSLMEAFAARSVQNMQELNGVGNLLFVVSRTKLDDDSEQRIFAMLALYKNIKLLELDVDDNEYPPLQKTMLAFEQIASHVTKFDFVMAGDNHTYVHPSRILDLVKDLDPEEHLYMGRPLHHCLCQQNPQHGADCKADTGISYCAGMGFIMSRATMTIMQKRWIACADPDSIEFKSCRSSDSMVGLCLNRAGIRCSSAAPKNHTHMPQATHGTSWAEPNAKGFKISRYTVFCQDRGHHGIGEIGNFASSYTFDRSDMAHCAAFHPLKRAEHFRYIRYGITGEIEEPITPETRCKVAIGILTVPANHVPRDVVRQTWGKVAKATHVAKVFFVIGKPKVPLAPHELLQLNREMRLHDDMVLLNVSDAYDTLYTKSVAWLSWAAQNVAHCDYVYKTEDDSYVRALPLLNFLSRTTAQGGLKDSYFGMQWKTGSGAKVIKDPASPWYMYDLYPHNTYPPYMSGAGYGMSTALAAQVAARFPHHPVYRVEDAGIGILVNDIAQAAEDGVAGSLFGGGKLRYLSDRDLFHHSVCTAHTIMDNPAYSHGFNMYERYHDDLGGRFCARVDRSTMTPPSHSHRHSSSFFRFSPTAGEEGRLSFLDEAYAPWNRSNSAVYTSQKGVNRTAVKYIGANSYPWLLLADAGVYGDESVWERLRGADKDEAAAAALRARGVYRSVHPGCADASVKSADAWLKEWGEHREYVVQVYCDSAGANATGLHSTSASNLSLVHVPMLPDGGGSQSPRVTLLPVPETPLAVILPFACNPDALQKFLQLSGQGLAVTPGRRRIIIAWAQCGSAEIQHDQLDEAVVRFRRKLQGIEVKLVVVAEPFARGPVINAALRHCLDEEVAVVVDVDMALDEHFFRNCRAFARHGHSAYFPIVFSNYNPAVVAAHAEHFARPPVNFSNPFAISADLGFWRRFGFGMVAVPVKDARAVGMYNSSITEWGLEDVEFYGSVVRAGYMVWRAFERGAVHVWHPKDCSKILGIGHSRYRMCLGSKLAAEGTAQQVALAMFLKIGGAGEERGGEGKAVNVQSTIDGEGSGGEGKAVNVQSMIDGEGSGGEGKAVNVQSMIDGEGSGGEGKAVNVPAMIDGEGNGGEGVVQSTIDGKGRGGQKMAANLPTA